MKIRIIITIVLLATISFLGDVGQKAIDMETAQVAASQLNSSDGDYIAFQTAQHGQNTYKYLIYGGGLLLLVGTWTVGKKK